MRFPSFHSHFQSFPSPSRKPAGSYRKKAGAFALAAFTFAGLGLSAPQAAVLLYDEFDAPNDSLWHFRGVNVTADSNRIDTAFTVRLGVGGDMYASYIRVDAARGKLLFKKPFTASNRRGVFMAYRDDFLNPADPKPASQVKVTLLDTVFNWEKMGNDAAHGSWVLVKYLDTAGAPRFARAARPLLGLRDTLVLDNAVLQAIDTANIAVVGPALSDSARNRAVNHIVGVGLYLTTNTRGSHHTASMIGGILVTGKVDAPLQLRASPRSDTLTGGDTAALSAWVLGRDTIAYKWLKNDTVITGAGDFHYRFVTGLRDSGSHRFRLEAKNADSTVTSAEAVITVLPAQPVVFTDEPDSVKVLENLKATFTGTATGTGPISYQWLRNGQPVAKATTNSLRFTWTTLADSGLYALVATNRLGSDTSAAVPLLVEKAAPAVITTEPAAQQVELGQTAEFTVTAEGGGELTYQWYRNGIAIPGAKANKLQFMADSASMDSSEFWVIVGNPFHEGKVLYADTSAKVRLTLAPATGIARLLKGSAGILSFNGPRVVFNRSAQVTLVGADGRLLLTKKGRAGETLTLSAEQVRSLRRGSAFLRVEEFSVAPSR